MRNSLPLKLRLLGLLINFSYLCIKFNIMSKKKITIWVPRMLKHEDYDVLVKWWDKWKFAAPSREFLPDDGTCGVMLEDSEGNQYAAGFIYFTNSNACWMEFIVTNPFIKDKAKRKGVINDLIKYLEYLAMDNGAKWIFTSVKHQGLKEKLIESGFAIGTENSTEMIKQL
ncbi:hypothetical protein PANI_CDS0073 [Maribacter phage Panino]